MSIITELYEYLSPRERDVLFAISDGLTAKQIGAKFGISHRTVETHRENLREKLGSTSTASITRKAVAFEAAGLR